MSKKKEVSQTVVKEDKSVKFVRVITPRMNKALKSIHLLGNCASSGYAYSDEQVEQLISQLRSRVDLLEQRFAKIKDKQSSFEFQS